MEAKKSNGSLFQMLILGEAISLVMAVIACVVYYIALERNWIEFNNLIAAGIVLVLLIGLACETLANAYLDAKYN